MHERRIVDHDQVRLFHEPAAVLSIRRKGLHVAEVAGRKSGVELCTRRRRVFLDDCSPRGVAKSRVLLTGECRVLRRAHVTQVADDVHDFVIAEEHVHGAAGRLRLLLEAHQEIEGLSRIRAPIDDISESDQVCLAAAPVQRIVDNRRLAQECDELVVRPVNVRENDDSVDAFEPVRRIGGRRYGRMQQQDCSGDQLTTHGEYHRSFAGSAPPGQAMTTLAGKMMLQRCPLFRGLPGPSLDRIAALAVQRSFRDGEIVFSQGDPGDALYAVVAGRIRISSGHGGRPRDFRSTSWSPADTFGEIALLDGGTRTATATASEPSELVSIRRDHFAALLEREPRVALELLKLCGQLLRWTSALVEDAAFLDAPGRLAKRLLSLSELHGQRTKAGTTLKISQEDLATFLGVSRQVVNQYLQGWKAQGWVDLGRGSVTVRNEAAIRQAAQAR